MITVLVAEPKHIQDIFRVRTAVKENAADMARLAELGITPESVAAVLSTHCKAWVAMSQDEVVGFSISDAKTESIWALFVLPEFENQGLGRRLMAPAVDWLWQRGATRIWLTTGPTTRAAGFYRHLGWRETCLTPRGEMRFELELPTGCE